MDDLDDRAEVWPGYVSLGDAIQRVAEWRFTKRAGGARTLSHALASGRLEALERNGDQAYVRRAEFWKRILDHDLQFPPGPGFMLYGPAFELWLETIPRLDFIDDDDEATGSAELPISGRRGRPKGSGSYKAADAALVEEIRAMLVADPDLPVHKAAQSVADRAEGGGTIESKARRLVGRYGEKYGD